MPRASTAQKTPTSDTQHPRERPADKSAGRALHLVVPEAEFAELSKPKNERERETAFDESLDVQLATIEELPCDWATDQDWRKREAKLNALPQFMTEIDGLDILLIACLVFLIL